MIPNAECRKYLPTFSLECGNFARDVGKESIHGASGMFVW